MAFRDEEKAWLGAIRHDPDNDCLRLSLARLLEQRGDPLGEFIRLQCACHCLDCSEGVDWDDTPLDAYGKIRISPTLVRRMQGLTRREAELLHEYGTTWLGHPPQEVEAEFSRGLPTLTMSAHDLARDDMSQWFQTQRHWVFELHLWGEEASFEQDMHCGIERGLLEPIATLQLGISGLADAGIEQLAQLTQLRHLTLTNHSADDIVFTGTGLKSLSTLPQLRELHLEFVDITDLFLENLGKLAQLQFLELKSCSYSDITEAAKTHLARLRRLRALWLSGSEVTDTLLHYFTGLNGLRELQLHHATQVTDAGLAHLADLSQLKSLEFNRMTITDIAMQHLSRISKLNTLVVQSPDYYSTEHLVSDSGLRHLTGLAELRRLTLNACPITNAGFDSLSELSELRSLDLKRSHVTYAGVGRLAGLSQLDELIIPSSKMTDQGLEELARLVTDRQLQHLGKLVYPRALTLDRTVSFTGLHHLSALTQLRGLSLDRSLVLDGGLKHLAGLKLLRNLNLQIDLRFNDESASGANDFAEDVFQHVGRLIQLRDLSLSIRPTEAGLRELAELTSQLPELKVKTILYREEVTDAFLRKLAESMQRLPTLQQLPRLNFNLELECDGVTDTGLRYLVGLTRLRSLDLSHCSVSDAGVASLAGLTGLEELDLSCCDITDSGLSHLAGLTQLRRLDVDHNLVTDEGLKYLAGLTQLEDLDLYRSANITDAGMEHLAGLTCLRMLNLAYSQITDAGLQQLVGLPRLRDLWLGDAPVTTEGIKNFTRTLVDCWVTHDDS